MYPFRGGGTGEALEVRANTQPDTVWGRRLATPNESEIFTKVVLIHTANAIFGFP